MASPPPPLSSNFSTYASPTLHDTPNPRSRPPDSERYGSPNAHYPPIHAPSPLSRFSRQSPPYIRPPYLGAPPPHPPAPPFPPRPRPVHQSYIPPLYSPPPPISRYSSGGDPAYRLPPVQSAFHHPPRHTSLQLPTQYRHAPHSDEEGRTTGTSADRVEQRLHRSQTTSRHDSTSSPGSYGGGNEDLDDGMGQIDPRLLAEAEEEEEEEDAANSDCVSSPKDPGIGLPGSEKRNNEAYYPGAHHQAQFAEFKKNGNYTPSSINLNSLDYGEPGERPKYPMSIIIKCAILGSPRQRLTLNELYKAIEQRFSYYKTMHKKDSWKSTVRRTLSFKQKFVKEPRPITEPGNGNHWLLASNEPQGNKKRKPKGALAEQEPPEDTAQPTLPPKTQPTSAYGSPRTAAAAAIDTTTTVGVIHHNKTVPASAESYYAAVTSSLPNPAPIDVDSLQPWVGTTEPESQPAGTVEQQAGPSRHKEVTSPSSIRPQRTQTKRAQHRYNPLSVIRPLRSSNLRQPQDTFNALAAEIARDGIERSGGPALRAPPTLVTRDDENESDSEQGDDSDETLPDRRRMSRRGM